MTNFRPGDKVIWKGYTGKVTIVTEQSCKVIFDDGDGPDYWYYLKEELEKVNMPKYENGQNIAKIENNFKYHSPKEDQPERYVQIRDKAKELALLANELTPASREQSLGFTALEEAVMWFNASIARNE